MSDLPIAGVDTSRSPQGAGGAPAGVRSAAGLVRALRAPRQALSFAWARLRGEWYRLYLGITRGERFRAGPGLRVHGRLIVRGPGRVVLGRDVQIWDRVTPWTYDREAVISIGDFTVLDGTRFGCRQRIEIGAGCRIADCRMMDTDFHTVRADRRWDPNAPVRVAPVTVGDNVWIAGLTGVLPGTRIGRDSVVSFGAVCSSRYQEGVILAGNPARVAGFVPGARRAPAAPSPVAGGVTHPPIAGGPDAADPDPVTRLVADTLAVPPAAVRDDLAFDQVPEWDSLGHLALMLALETAYGTKIGDELVVELTSVAAIRQFVAGLPPSGG